MKVLQVNNVYGEKSTGKITMQIHRWLLQNGHESVVVYGRGKGNSDDGLLRLCTDWYGKINSLMSRITGMPYGGCLVSTLRLFHIIQREQPDVVHLQCINGNFVNIYWLISWLKKHQIKTVVSLHAEFMYTANCGHAFECMQWQSGCNSCPDVRKATRSWFFSRTAQSWEAMKRAFAGFEGDCIVVAVSPWTEMRAKESVILNNFDIITVMNGVDTTGAFCGAGDEVEENTVLNVTAHFSAEPSHNKGGWYILQLAKRMPEVTFYVAGHSDDIVDKPDNLLLLGEIRDQGELADLYRKVKVSLVVSKRETFSMPCAESLCCGTPVVGFKAGAPELISMKKYSEFVEYGDLAALEQVLDKWLRRDDVDRGKLSDEACRLYSSDAMVQHVLEVYRRVQ